MEIAPKTGGNSKEDFDMLEMLLEASGGHVTWLAITKRYDVPDAHMRLIKRLEPLVARGGRPQLLAVPLIGDIDLRSPFMFSPIPVLEPGFQSNAGSTKAALSRPGLPAQVPRGDQDLSPMARQPEPGLGQRDQPSGGKTSDR